MTGTGAVLDMSAMGARVEIRRSDAELVEFDVIGRPFGLVAQPHIHTRQREHYEVLEGTMKLIVDGHERILGPGDTGETPPGVAHTQAPGDGHGVVRIRTSPAGGTEAFLRRLSELCTTGQMNKWGFPKPLAGARLALEFAGEGHAAKPPLRVQLALARGIVRLASPEYLFVDEWDVAAPREAVFAAVADAHSYPEWWKPVYIDVESEGEPAVGKTSRQHFKGRLPYHLHTASTITRMEEPHIIEADVVGDLSGHGTWTLTETAGGTHVRFDWEVTADRRLLRMLSPVLRPALRWNHAWAIARAIDGLEPYAQRLAARDRVSA
jgi:uncharacterized protein YndB with AHSA1/START domain/quercetin dioxygenase-like cupin family protein